MSKRDNIASGENTKTWSSVKEFFLFTVLTVFLILYLQITEAAK